MNSRGVRGEETLRPRLRFRLLGLASAILLATCCAAAGFDVRLASAATPGGGFTMTLASSSARAVPPGHRVEFSFEFTNGDSVTNSPLIATDTVPAGTTLVPHSQSCGSGGAACTESWSGPVLQWELPAGARPRAFIVISFAVAVATNLPPAEVVTRLTFSGPGCPYSEICSAEPPSVDVQMLSQRASSVAAATTTATTAPHNDVQNLTVQVPKCSHGHDGPRCHISPRSNSGPQGPKVPHTVSSGHQSGEAGPTALAATGDDEVRNIEAGLLCLGLGTCLVLASLPRPRRRSRLASREDIEGGTECLIL